MFKDILKLTLSVVLLFVIWGCGTMSKEEDSISVPQTVSIEMPKALKSTQTVEVKEKSLAYKELKDDIAYVEELSIDIEINLLFINEVISQIESRCNEVEINGICKIPDDTLFFIFDENLSQRYIDLTGEKAMYTIGEELTYGDIEFVRYSKSDTYQYRLKMDTSFYSEDEVSSETIKWSDDKRKIIAFFDAESSTLESEIVIDYLEEENGEKSILVDDLYLDKRDNSSDDFYLDLVKLNDINETYFVNSSSISINEFSEEYTVDTEGELSNNGGYLDFEGSYYGEAFKEYEVFDKDGMQVESFYCYENLDCDMDDEESWFED
jgi:hypothetical protein